MKLDLHDLGSQLRAPWQQAVARLDALQERERLALLGMVLGGLVAAELMVVLPIRERRDVVVAAMAAEVKAAKEAAAAEQARNAAEQSALESQLAAAELELKKRGAGARRSEPLGTWLKQALAGQPVQVVSLRGLSATEIEAPAPSATSDAVSAAQAAAPGASAAQDSAHGAPTPAAQNPALFRHRYELMLAGDVVPLIEAVRSLGERMQPLRIERVRMGSRDGQVVEATVGFVIISAERAWITL